MFDIEAIQKGDKRSIAEALNLLENRKESYAEQKRELIERLSESVRGERHVIGLTGPPGVGKSTMMTNLIQEYRARGKTVGVISVDPSSKKTGGALLGDRARMVYEPGDQGLFIRSMAAGSHMGGLAYSTRNCLSVFEAFYDVIILETVGVGQSETEIDQVAETVIFVVQPGSGDALQFMKAGVMEIPHVLVVNKADQKTLAIRARRDLMIAKAYSKSALEGWELEVVMMSALEGWGHKELVDILEEHRQFMVDKGLLIARRRQNREQWVSLLFKERFGNFGYEMLGGEAAVSAMIRRMNINNPFSILIKMEKLIREEMAGTLRTGLDKGMQKISPLKGHRRVEQ